MVWNLFIDQAIKLGKPCSRKIVKATINPVHSLTFFFFFFLFGICLKCKKIVIRGGRRAKGTKKYDLIGMQVTFDSEVFKVIIGSFPPCISNTAGHGVKRSHIWDPGTHY